MRLEHSRTAALGIVGANGRRILIAAEEMKQTPRDERTTKMTNVYEMLKTAAGNYARYRQTRDEIANLPLDVALDLGLYPGDADRIARDAVYGKAA
jgi:uncharacterized protein YjiS (DUF1127 family)